MAERRRIGWMRRLALKGALDRKEDFQEFAGVFMRKLPSDALAILKLLRICRPEVVVETGAAHGGSALMITSLAPHIGLRQIVSVDTQEVPRPSHPLIRFLTGSSVDDAIVAEIRGLVAGRACSLILDSDHNAPHVARELELLGGLVTPGQSLIVEDTHVDVLRFRKFREQGGPLRALDAYLRSHPEFAEAKDAEPYITTNYFGYRVRSI